MTNELDYSKLSAKAREIVDLLGYSQPHLYFAGLDGRVTRHLYKMGWLERNPDSVGAYWGYRLTPAGRAAYEAAAEPPAPVEGQTFSEVDSPIEPQDARPLRPDEVEPAHWTPEEWQSLYKGVREYSKQLVQERDDLRRQLAEAQGALKPFGEAYQQRPDKVTIINVPGISWEAWAEAARLITAAALTASDTSAAPEEE